MLHSLVSLDGSLTIRSIGVLLGLVSLGTVISSFRVMVLMCL